MDSDRLQVRVQRRWREADGIVGFEFVSLDGGPLPPFTAGAHIDVHLRDGLSRPYSLCNDPAERHRYCIAVLREPNGRGGSAAMHDDVQEGDALRIGAPRNHFPLTPGAAHSLLVAGGIGITPLLAMAEQLHRDGSAFDLHYCTRSAARTAFTGRLRHAPYADRVHFHQDDAPAAQQLDMAATLSAPHAGCHLYVCGPPGFLDQVRSTASGQGWDPSRVHFEYFGGAVTSMVDDGAFELVLQRSRRVVRVAPDQTAAEAIAGCGVHLDLSCQQGVCGTCLTRVVEGEVDHRDLFLTPEEQASHREFLPCCSRARGLRLVIDL